jgi:phospholipid transport system transporter-binding protein
MSNARIEAVAPGRWRISGQLTLSTVAQLALEGKRLAALGAKTGAGSSKAASGHEADVQLDLSGVEQGSSAGVALLLELQQAVFRGGSRLHLSNVPESLARIAELSNVDDLLGIGTGQSGAIGPTQAPTRR